VAGVAPSGVTVGARLTDLAHGWHFLLSENNGTDAPDDGDLAGVKVDDSRWRLVDLPHDWSIELPPTCERGTTSGTGFRLGGIGWYRRKVHLAQTSARRVSIEFDRVYMDASVYINGTVADRHAYGYTGFSVDVTDLIHRDQHEPDLVAVRVRHQVPSGRWYSGSGIIGGVRLVVTDHLYVKRWGIQVTTPELDKRASDDPATVAARAEIGNSTSSSAHVRVRFTVLDANGHEAGQAIQHAVIPVGGRPVAARVYVGDPTLWSTDCPYLYSMRVDVQIEDRIVDSDVTTFGMRHFRFDADEGFFLNGRKLTLHGVNLHHDQGALGAVAHPDSVRRQVDLMRRMGANAVRTAHNPPTPELLDACQRSGVLMIVEAFDCWVRGKVKFDYGRFFERFGISDVTEMVRAARNSPAVIMWSIGNEIPDAVWPDGVDTARRLVEAIRAADHTRPVALCSAEYRGLPAPGTPRARLLNVVDALGVNYNTAASIDALHAACPGLCLFESESSAQVATRGVYERPDLLNVGENHTPGRRGASSYDNTLMPWALSGEYVLKVHRDRPFLAGQFVWAGFDYLGEPTPFDVFPVKASLFGLMDTAGFAKDQYYLFQSQWSAIPMVHLVPMDWTRHQPGDLVEVRAYANAESVELFLNDTSLGVRRFDRKTIDGVAYLETAEPTRDGYTSPNGGTGKLHLTWHVPFSPGALTAVAYHEGVEIARDQLATAGPAYALRLTPDRRIDTDGGALAFVTIDVVDERGVLVPDAANAVEVEVTGGMLASLDNGRQESAEPYQSTTMCTAFNGKALAIVRLGTGPAAVAVTASSPTLKPSTVTIRPGQTPSRPVRDDRTPTTTVDRPRVSQNAPVADASYSGRPDTVPATMLDGAPDTGWSNHCLVPATPVLPGYASARPFDWVSLAWAQPRRIRVLVVVFRVDEHHSPPGVIDVLYLDACGVEVPIAEPAMRWTGPSVSISFPPALTTRIRLALTSAHPAQPHGSLGIISITADTSG
jgi:beta-galactosidase